MIITDSRRTNEPPIIKQPEEYEEPSLSEIGLNVLHQAATDPDCACSEPIECIGKIWLTVGCLTVGLKLLVYAGVIPGPTIHCE